MRQVFSLIAATALSVMFDKQTGHQHVVIETEGDEPIGGVAAPVRNPGLHRTPVGPFDVFTGPWQKGDRQPTDMEQILYKPNGWFDNLADTSEDFNQHGNESGLPYNASRLITFSKDGQIAMPYARTQQIRTLMRGCVPGKVSIDMGVIDGPDGVMTVSVKSATGQSCAGRFALGQNPAIMEGDSVKQLYVGPDPDLAVPVGAHLPGYNRPYKQGEHAWLICDFDAVSSDVVIEVAGHNRQG